MKPGRIFLHLYLIILLMLPSLQGVATVLSRNFRTAFIQSGNNLELSGNHMGLQQALKKQDTGIGAEDFRLQLRNSDAKFGRKALRGSLLSFGYEAITGGSLLIVPESFSKWDKDKIDMGNNLRIAWTMPPVVDDDFWFVNYLGHPYQGGCYYNAVRSQGATIVQSSLFGLFHSMLWEYVIEAVAERPSIQDMVITPISGALVGELIHRMTIKMSKNGYLWYEKTIICLLNPMFAVNNGFGQRGKRNPEPTK